MTNNELAAAILHDEIRDHEAGRCSCFYSQYDPDGGDCIVVLWRNKEFSDAHIIAKAPKDLVAHLQTKQALINIIDEKKDITRT